jgi:hypothetical protein
MHGIVHTHFIWWYEILEDAKQKASRQPFFVIGNNNNFLILFIRYYPWHFELIEGNPILKKKTGTNEIEILLLLYRKGKIKSLSSKKKKASFFLSIFNVGFLLWYFQLLELEIQFNFLSFGYSSSCYCYPSP